MDTPNTNGTAKTSTSAPAPLLLDAGAVAKMLNISKATLWRMRDSGKLPMPVRLGACVRWPRSNIEAWIADGCPSLASGR